MRATEREVGGYRLLRQIGCGGMSTVYEAVNGGGDRVALKLLHPSIAADESSRLRLQREVAVLRRVRSPYVAEVIDAEIDGVEPFVVTELIDGLTLEKDVEINGIYTEEDLLQLGEKLADALRSVHELGVVHRDLKPSNVMLSDSRPVLIDFGIAQDINATRLTQQGALALTPGYCDPRVLRGDEPDRAADWWALAAVLAYAATGEPPFGSGSTPMVLQRVIQGQASFPGLEESSAQAFRAALATDVHRRLSYSDLLEALRDPSAFVARTLIASEQLNAGLPNAELINGAFSSAGISNGEFPSAGLLGTEPLNGEFSNKRDGEIARDEIPEGEIPEGEIPARESLTLGTPAPTIREPIAATADTSYISSEDDRTPTAADLQLPAPAWARPPKKVRLTLLIAWFVLIFFGARFPIAACTIFVFVVFIFDVIGRSAGDMRDRRLRRGTPKKRDALIAAIRSPLALLGAALRTIGAVAVVGVSVYCCLLIAATISHGSLDFSHVSLDSLASASTASHTAQSAENLEPASLSSIPALLKPGGSLEWAAAVSGIFSCGVWFFPGRKYACEGARYVLGGAADSLLPRLLWIIVAAAALAAGAYAVLSAGAADVSWAPLSEAFRFLG